MTGPADRSVTIRLRMATDTFDAAALRAGATVRVLITEIEAAGSKAHLTGKELDKLGFNADGSAKSMRQLAADTKKASDSNNDAAKSGHLLLTTLVGLGPALIPIGAVALGAVGTLGLMGVSGVLAIKGIQNQMKSGTAIGSEYATGVRVLGNDLHILETTAARGLLGPFNAAVITAQRSMPGLNTEVQRFAALGGRTAGNIFTGLLADGKTLSPLFNALGMDILHISKDFETWSAGGGLQKFETYAMNALPKVENTLEAVASAIAAITGASAPMGIISTEALGMVAQAINLIPTGVLHTLIPLLAAGYLGFKAYETLAPAIATIRTMTATLKAYEVQQLMSAGVTAEAAAANSSAAGGLRLIATNGALALGGIGLVTAGLIAGTVALARHADADKAYDYATKNATQTTSSFEQALIAANGVVNASVTGTVALALQQSGLADRAAKSGISLQQLTSAVTGNNAEFAKMLQTWSASGDPSGKTVLALTMLHNQFLQGAADQKAYSAATSSTTAVMTAHAALVQHEAEVYGTTTTAYEAATKATKDNATQLAATTLQMQLQENASGLLKASLDALDGKQLSDAQSQNQFEQSLVNMVKKIGQGDAALVGMSSSAIENRGELLNMVTAAETAAGASGDLSKSSVQAKADLLRLRQQIIDNAVAHGEDRAAVTAYINTVLDIKKLSVPPTKLDVDTSAALARMAALRAEITRTVSFIDGQVAVVHVSTYNPATRVTTGGKQVTDSIPGHATGGGIADGWFTTGERGWELGYKSGPNVQMFPHDKAQKMLPQGPSVPAYAAGTSGIVTITPKKASSSKAKAASKAAANKAAALQKAQASIRWTISTDLPKVAQGALGSAAAVAAAMGKLINDVHTATTRGLSNAGLVTSLQVENRAMQGLAKERTVIAGQLKTADQALANARKQFADEQKAVADTERGLFDISTAGAGPNGMPSTATSIVDGLQAEVTKIKTFNAELAGLKAKGLDNNLAAKLGEDGADVAGANVDALSHASKSQIGKIDSLYGQVNTSANKLGTQIAGSLFQAGVDSAAGYIKGLQSKDKAVAQAASSLAATVSNQVRKDLGIRSPSTVFYSHGANTWDGWVLGANSRIGAVKASTSSLVSAASAVKVSGYATARPYTAAGGAGLVQLSTADRQLLSAAIEAMGDVRVSGRLTADGRGITAAVSTTSARGMRG